MSRKILLLTLGMLCLKGSHSFAQFNGNARYVDPFIGTAVQGHTYPGATAPFGLVQVSPETGNVGWNYCSGYHYEDKTIMGFSHTHLSGTGWMDLGDLLMLPFTGEAKPNMRSKFSHTNEKAEPGYYRVKLDDDNINVELTATPHAAYHKYRFSDTDGRVLIDLKHGIVPDSAALQTHVLKSEIKLEGKNSLTGFIQTKGWAGNKHVYFVIRFKLPVASLKWLSPEDGDRNQQLAVAFKSRTALMIEAKVGLSTVSIAGARLNLATEMPHWNFNAQRKANYKVWDEQLSTVRIKADVKQKRIFYTALYHNLIVPNNIADVDGKYRGANNEVASANGSVYYSTLSLWDTFRATNSLYCLLYPQVTNGIVQTMLAHQQVRGILPIWTLWGHENFGMIGNHSIPVIAEAYKKGIRNYPAEKVYEAMKVSSTLNHNKSDWTTYTKYGYYPADVIKNESVSRTLESAYNDACVAEMAKALGKINDAQMFAQRALSYRKLYNPATNFFQGRKADGSWDMPFNPLRFSHASTGGNYTEGNAWPYQFHVMHDVPGLINLFGGIKGFTAKLDTMFTLETPAFAHGAKGNIGQYVHGNEPSHHVAYLYNYAQQPGKTQQIVNKIITTLYNDTPAGLCGNDDCGQMSAWYIFGALGFYPVHPASGSYVLGAPLYPEMKLRLGNKTLNIKAINKTDKNIYVQQIRFNGQIYSKGFIEHAILQNGGLLEFVMGEQPTLQP